MAIIAKFPYFATEGSTLTLSIDPSISSYGKTGVNTKIKKDIFDNWSISFETNRIQKTAIDLFLDSRNGNDPFIFQPTPEDLEKTFVCLKKSWQYLTPDLYVFSGVFKERKVI